MFLSDPVTYHSRLAESWSQRYLRPGFQSRIEVFGKAIDEFSEVGQCWLDAGCGTGEVADLLRGMGREVSAIDASSEMVKHCRVPAQVAAVEQLPFRNDTFSGVVCSSVLEYLKQPELALQEFRRVLKPGGHLLISVPNSQSALRKGQRALYAILRVPRYMEYSRHAYTAEQFDAMLSQHGFAPERTEHFGSVFLGSKQLPFGYTLRLHIARKIWTDPPGSP
jgi:2-polyprenyl-6-hydroxyphenyl methylase/3-demethylubiquinone-9 3-methyltransferase